MRKILVVDDDRNHLRIIKGLLEKQKMEVFTAREVDLAVPLIEKLDLQLILTDLKMPGKDGMALLMLSRERKPELPVIMITGHGDIETAVTAMKQGAHDFITKPFDEDELLTAVQKALAEYEKNRELVSSYFDVENPLLPEVIGQAPAIAQIMQSVKKIAATDATVLVGGETGVGKELVARTIHAASRRHNEPFVKVNCAAIPEALAESEFFGYERGAFTGAMTSKPGRFELAHRGTIFLDEIGEMPLSLQSRFLGVLQDKAFERVGGVKTIKVDVRIIAATNKNLQADVQAGKFRADIFYRLNVVSLLVPPLRERKDDIAPLTAHYLKKFALRYRKKVTGLTPEAMAAFICYDWPGNIRELENALERMVLMSETEALGPEYMPAELQGAGASSSAPSFKEKLADAFSMTEKQMIVEALNKTAQNRTDAAKLLGVSRRTLQNKVKEYGL